RHPLPEECHHQDRDDDHVHVDEERGLGGGRQQDALVLQVEAGHVDRTEGPDERLPEHAEIETTEPGEDEQSHEGPQGHPRERQEEGIDRTHGELGPGKRRAPQDGREQDEDHVRVAAANTTPNTIKLGFTISLTGQFNVEGTNSLRGIQTATQWLNDHGGVTVGGKSYNITLDYYDDQSQTSQIAPLYTRIVQQD